jgi:hypothetical protein
MKINNQKGFIVPLLIAIIAVLLIGGGVYIYSNEKVEAPIVVDTNVPTQATSTQATSTQTSDWKTYTNTQYGFSFSYPSDVLSTPVENNVNGRIQITAPYLSTGPIDSNKVELGEVVKPGLLVVVLKDNQYNQEDTYEKRVTDYSGVAGTEMYNKINISGQSAFRAKDATNDTHNFITLIHLKDPYYIDTLQMEVYKITSGFAEGYKWAPVADKDNSTLFNQILSTFKFTN